MFKRSSKDMSNNFKIGDRIFAKLKGYPYWPAKIEESPLSIKEATNNKKYQIIFYGTYEINWLKADALEPYNKETIETYGKQRKSNSFNKAMWEIENDPDFKLKRSRRDAKKDNTSYMEAQLPAENEDEDANDDENSKKSSSSSSTSNKAKKKATKESSRKSSRNIKSLSSNNNIVDPHKDQDNEELNDEENSNGLNSSSTSLNSEINVKKLKKPIVGSNKSDLTRRESWSENEKNQQDNQDEATLSESIDVDCRLSNHKKKSNKRYLDEEAINSDEQQIIAKIKKKRFRSGSSQDLGLRQEEDHLVDDNNKKKKNDFNEKSKKSRIKKIQKDVSSSASSSEETTKQVENVKEKEMPPQKTDSNDIIENTQKQRKFKKFERRIKRIRIQLALFKMDFEIKKSLRVDHKDENRCCLIMQDLLRLPFAKENLYIAPEIVETIKKCRKYKNSEQIRNEASGCFNKFCKILTLEAGESFWTTFEKDRDKYIRENLDKLKRDKKLANKLLVEDQLTAS